MQSSTLNVATKWHTKQHRHTTVKHSVGRNCDDVDSALQGNECSINTLQQVPLGENGTLMRCIPQHSAACTHKCPRGAAVLKRGSSPEMSLLAMSKYMRLVRLTTDGGISPVSRLLCRSITARLCSAPREDGRRPLMLEAPRKLHGQQNVSKRNGRSKENLDGMLQVSWTGIRPMHS